MLRFLPPLVVGEAEIDEGLAIVRESVRVGNGV
jgi:4-aminobutyrate aminotransferase-like enzyme